MGKLMNALIPSAQAKPTASQQLEAAQRAAKSYTPQQEASARSAGFKSADEQMVYLRQKNNRTGGSVPSGGKFGVENLVPSFHPRTTMKRATQAMKNAREQ